MMNLLKLLTMPSLSNAQHLEEYRQASMKHAKQALAEQMRRQFMPVLVEETPRSHEHDTLDKQA